jgi:hypothetical protein
MIPDNGALPVLPWQPRRPPTIVQAIFVPLTLLSAIYWMNFVVMSELTGNALVRSRGTSNLEHSRISNTERS